MSKTKDHKPNSTSHNDVIIAIMGSTGSGKSNFINVATKQTANTKVGHNLEPCTSEVHGIRYIRSDNTDSIRYVLLDTPGFDDTSKSDTEVLNLIAQWLKTTYKRDIPIAGIIYLHRISDNRMAGSPLKNLRMFGKLCGDDALGNVILATTMWDRVAPTIGERRETELKETYWKGMLALGSRAERFDGKFESAWDIIDVIAKKKQTDILALQEELVNLKRQLSASQAGMIDLCNKLQTLLVEHKETLRKLRDDAATQNDEELMEALNAEYDTFQQRLQSTFDQIASLKVSFGRRLLLLFSKKSRIVSKVLGQP